MFGIEIKIRQELLDNSTKKYIASFDCGNKTINSRLHKELVNDTSLVTHLYIDERNNHVIAFATLIASGITIVPDQIYDSNLTSTLIPSFEIKYFAVDKEYQHMKYDRNDPETLSFYIFSHVLSLICDVSESLIGAKQIVLYALQKAVNFYRRSGFVQFGLDMLGDEGEEVVDCVPMYINIPQ